MILHDYMAIQGPVTFTLDSRKFEYIDSPKVPKSQKTRSIPPKTKDEKTAIQGQSTVE